MYIENTISTMPPVSPKPPMTPPMSPMSPICPMSPMAPTSSKPAMASMCAISAFPENTPIAMAYVPLQKWEQPFAENVALEKGTIFPSLDLPFKGGEVYKNDK